jgi:hypothetical protein
MKQQLSGWLPPNRTLEMCELQIAMQDNSSPNCGDREIYQPFLSSMLCRAIRDFRRINRRVRRYGVNDHGW